MCIECATVLTWEIGMTLKVMSKAELMELPTEVMRDVVRHQLAIIELHQNKRRAKAAYN